MELDRIEKLLEKYLEASTSIAEEKELRTYFSQDNLPAAHLRTIRPYVSIFFFGQRKNGLPSKLPIADNHRIPEETYFQVGFRCGGSSSTLWPIYFGNEYQKREKDTKFAYNETKKGIETF